MDLELSDPGLGNLRFLHRLTESRLVVVPIGVLCGIPDLDDPEAVLTLHQELTAGGVRTTVVEDLRPAESYVTFRCWDPDDTEIEVFWQAP